MLRSKNDFAVMPPMGWNSYDYYDTTVTEADIRANADYMAKYLKPYGWEYIVVDIQWYAHGAGSRRQEFQYIPFSKLEMDDYGRLLPDPERFPSSVHGAGFGPLADYVHSLGLKFGIHIMRGVPRMAAHMHLPIWHKGDDMQELSYDCAEIANPSSICDWNPDMYGVRDTVAGQAYYDSLLELYASWGVDFIKCDDICNVHLQKDRPEAGLPEMRMLHRAIMKTGRDIVLSLSPGPAMVDHAWDYKEYANMWRITDDFWDNWDLLKDMFVRCERWQDHVGVGCYPDCDMLPMGKVGKGFGHGERDSLFTFDEQQTMLTLWCLFGSPLMIGAELTKLDETTRTLLTNGDILEMRKPQYMPHQILREEKLAVWEALYDGEQRYVAVFNLSDDAQQVDISNYVRGSSAHLVRDLWTGNLQELSTKRGIPAHGCLVYKI